MNSPFSFLFTHSRKYLLAVILATTAAAVPAFGAQPPQDKGEKQQKQEIIITADSAIFDRTTSSAEYKGKVTLVHGSITLNCSKLVIQVEGEEISTAVATGKPATARQENPETGETMEASGETITYAVSSREMVIRGDAYINSSGTIFQGQELIYNLENEQINAEGTAGEGEEKQQILLVLPLDEETDERE